MRLPRLGRPRTVLVYQPGKTGSQSVHRALLRCGYRFGRELADLEGRGDVAFHLHRHDLARALIGHSSRRRMAIVTMVRDPLRRAVSSFFQNGDQPGNRWHIGAREAMLGMTPAELVERFRMLSPGAESALDRWFEAFGETVGADVFTQPMSDDGFVTLQARIPAAIVRLENLEDATGRLGAFLGVRSLQPEPVNTAADKWYAALHAGFLARFAPTSAELDGFYGSRTARHFYRPAELAAMRARWPSCPGNDGPAQSCA